MTKFGTNQQQILQQINQITQQNYNANYEQQIWQIADDNHITDIYDLINYFENNIDNVKLFKYFYQHYELLVFKRPSVTTDTVYLRYNYALDKLQIYLTKRLHEPFKDQLALPGGFLKENQSINQAVITQTKHDLHINIKQSQIINLPAVSKPGRDPRMWVITNPNIVLLNPTQNITDNWFTLQNHFNIKQQLAFDHQTILHSAFDYLKQDLDHQRLPLIIKLLGPDITLPSLRDLLAHFEPKFKTQATANILKRYKQQLIKTDHKLKPPKGSKGGRSMSVYTYNNF